MEYIFKHNSLEHRAAQLSQMKLISVHGGGENYLYTDYGLKKVEREYKKLLSLLQQAQSENTYNRSL